MIVLGPSFSQPKRVEGAPRPPGMPRDSYQMSGPTHEAKLAALIAEVGKIWKLNPKIVVHGFSAGAQFAHRFAFKHPEQVVGVSAHSGGSWAKLEGDDKTNPQRKASSSPSLVAKTTTAAAARPAQRCGPTARSNSPKI